MGEMEGMGKGGSEVTTRILACMPLKIMAPLTDGESMRFRFLREDDKSCFLKVEVMVW